MKQQSSGIGHQAVPVSDHWDEKPEMSSVIASLLPGEGGGDPAEPDSLPELRRKCWESWEDKQEFLGQSIKDQRLSREFWRSSDFLF